MCVLSICENVMKIMQIMGKLCLYVYAHVYQLGWYKLYKKKCAIWITVDIDVLDISRQALEHLGR